MVEWRRERQRWVAILAAYALVLQALLAGLGAGTAAAAPAQSLDAVGGVICSFDGGAGHGTPADLPSHQRTADCLAHCAFSLHAALPTPAAPGLDARLAWTVGAPALAWATTHPRVPAIGPLGPRGPPA